MIFRKKTRKKQNSLEPTPVETAKHNWLSLIHGKLDDWNPSEPIPWQWDLDDLSVSQELPPPPSPKNKALLGEYEGTMMVNNPLFAGYPLVNPNPLEKDPLGIPQYGKNYAWHFCLQNQSATPPSSLTQKNIQKMENPPWMSRCISYWKWWFSNVIR